MRTSPLKVVLLSRGVYPMRSFLISILAIGTIVLLLVPMMNSVAGPTQSDPEPVPTPLNFNDGATGTLTPLSVDTEQVEQVTIYGSPQPAPYYFVGRWGTNDIKMPISIYGNFHCSLWAESADGARNAQFIVHIYKNSELVAEFNTSREDMDPTPTLFEITDVLNVDLNVGDNLVVWLYFRSDLILKPGQLFPKPAQAKFLYGGETYNSGISVVTLPIIVDILDPEIDKGIDFIGFRTKVQEAFDVDPSKMNFTLTITPPKDGEVRSLSEVDATKTDDGIIFSRDWDYNKDKAKDGKYTVTMEVRYGQNTTTFSNTTSFDIDVPEKPVTDLGDTPINPAVAALAVIGIVVVVLAIYLNRRGYFKRRKGKGKKAPPKKGKAPPKKGKAASKRSPPKKKEPEEDEEDED